MQLKPLLNSLADEFPVFHLQCVTMRKAPVYVTTVVGRPPMEDVYLGKASERSVELLSLNPAYPPRTVPRSEVQWMARILWASQ